MVDGETVMMTMVMISSESPSRQGARTELLIPGIEIASAAERRCVSRNMTNPPSNIRSRALSSPKGSVGGCPRWPHPRRARAHPGRAQVGCGCLVQPLRPPSGSVGLPVSYDVSNKNWGFSRKLIFLHKRRHQGNSAENSVSPC